jgi:uncharacterized protein DUF2637
MGSKTETRAHLGIAVVVGAIGGAVGFKHSHDWAQANGQTDWIAWAVAVVIECMAIVAGLELKRKISTFPVLVLIGAFLLQMAAQVASAPRTVAGWLIAATPALGFLVITKMLLGRMVEQQRGQAVVTSPLLADARPVEPVAARAERADHDRHLPAQDVREIEPPAVPLAPVPAHPAVASWPPRS